MFDSCACLYIMPINLVKSIAWIPYVRCFVLYPSYGMSNSHIDFLLDVPNLYHRNLPSKMEWFIQAHASANEVFSFAGHWHFQMCFLAYKGSNLYPNVNDKFRSGPIDCTSSVTQLMGVRLFGHTKLSRCMLLLRCTHGRNILATKKLCCWHQSILYSNLTVMLFMAVLVMK